MKIRTLLFDKLKLILLFIIACFALNTQTAKGQEVITFKWLGDTSPKDFTIRTSSGTPFTVDWGDGKTTPHTGNGNTSVTCTQPTAYGNTTSEYEVTVTAGVGCVLTYLNVRSKQIVSLDLSRAPSLTALYCEYNTLTTLDISKNTALTGLYCSNSPLLTTLDVSKNTALITLYCDNNSLLTKLDVSANTKLTNLYCYSNSLTSLKINPSTAASFTTVNCFNNKIPLSDLKVLPSIAQIGVQTLPAQTVERNQAIMVDDAYNGEGTTFAITLGGSTAVENTHYTTDAGKITFKSTGQYVVTMKNNTLGAQTGSYVAQIKTTFNVVKSTDAKLKSLTVSQGTLTFNKDITTYNVSVPYSTESITIDATANDVNATLSGNGAGTGAKPLKPGNNDFNIEVTADDGSTTKTYKVTVNRTDVTLKTLTVSSGSLSPTFAPTDTVYTVNVPFSIKSITIDATKNNTNASVAGVGVKNLNVGNNVFNIEVKAQDGSIITYKVTVNRTDVTLKTLTVSSGSLSPTFAPTDTVYTVNVPYSIDSIAITATANATAIATVTGAGTDKKALKPGNNNVFNIKVTAQDGSTITYKVTVNRTDVTLKTLTVSSGSLSPTFAADKLNYTVNVPYPTDSIAITATANATAIATVTGAGTDKKALKVGSDNVFNVKVTAQDGSTITYTVTVTRDAASTDATLSSLTVSPGVWDSEFEPSMTMYTVIVPYATTSVTIEAKANDTKALSVTGGGEKNNLKVGNNVFDIDVTAEDGTRKNYKVNVIRKTASTNAALSSLTVSKGELTPKFDPDITDYTVTIGNSTDSIAVGAAVKDATASFTGDGKKKLIVGDNIFELVVKAQDGSTRTYTVTVTRKPVSTDATLSKLELSQGKLVPDFNPAVTDYTVKLDNSATSISFGTMFGDSTSTVTITKIKIADTASKQAPANELRSTAAKAMPLDPGVNYFVIAVTAEDGKSTLLYIITVIRGAPLGLSSDTRLSNLWLSSGATLTPDFKPYVKNYNVTVGTETEEIQINAIASDFKATIEGTGVKRLAAGENRFNLKVTAEDKTQDIYTITITRGGNSVGLEEITRDPIQVYPNPVQDYFRVKGITEPATVSVYSLQGSLMLHRKAEPDEQIYVGNLAKGIYLVRVNGMVFKVLKR